MKTRRAVIIGGAAVTAASVVPPLWSGTARAKSPADFRPMGKWPLRNSEAFEYHSRIVGDTMAIGVWSPPPELLARSKQPGAPLDIVYVLDGAFALGITATCVMLQYADLIDPGFTPVLLVGLDYPEGRVNGRSRDYTMVDSVASPLKEYVASLPPVGGADRFLAFLEEELDPFIRSKYKVTNKPAAVLGDSWGATLTFYAFLKQSKLFDRYWLGSPAIFKTGTDYVEQFEARLKGKLVHPTKMFLSMGSREMDGGVDFYEDMGRNYKRIESALEKVPNGDLTWSSKIYDGYTHTSAFAPALNDAVLYLFHK